VEEKRRNVGVARGDIGKKILEAEQPNTLEDYDVGRCMDPREENLTHRTRDKRSPPNQDLSRHQEKDRSRPFQKGSRIATQLK